jgi:hypothetical protein
MNISPIAAGAPAPAAVDPASTGTETGQQPSVYDIAGFREAFAQTETTNVAPSAESVLTPGSVNDSEGMRAVFSTLDSLNGRAEKLEINSKIFTSGERDMTPGEMLMLTVQAHEFLFHAQLTANVANRTSDGVQQLFRQQA